ncbi:hypothetical protein DFH28DRAFT_1077641 [Melampsora americana]|nr:hypothetical protein DFH28DRAFT_1077641 [Melampsora americana]
MEYSDIELNELAKRYSKKRGMSADDEVYLLELHDQLEKVITINCIILGKTMPYRGVNGFQVFQGTEEAKAIVKENGGIRAPGTNAKVGEAWNQLGKVGQDYYHAQAAESVRKKQFKKAKTSSSTSDNSTSNSTTEPIDAYSTLNGASETAIEIQGGKASCLTVRPAKVLDKRSAPNGDLFPRNEHFKKTNQNRSNKLTNIAYMIIQANHIAKTYKVQIAIICVSSFLGSGNMQLVEATPRLRTWFELERTTNPENHVVARMQSAITGWNTDDLAELGPVFEADEVSKARAGMNRLILQATRGKVKKWPWTNQKRLNDLGYEIRLLPGASTSLDILTRPSNKLLPAQAIDVNQSLLAEKIQIVKEEVFHTQSCNKAQLVTS